jgi:hypothetical protein
MPTIAMRVVPMLGMVVSRGWKWMEVGAWLDDFYIANISGEMEWK